MTEPDARSSDAERLFLKHWPHWRKFAYAMVRNGPDAEEVVQAALYKTLSGGADLSDHTAANHYVRKTICTEVINLIRHRTRWVLIELSEHVTDTIPAEAPNPLSWVLALEEDRCRQGTLAVALAALERLPPGQRDLIERFLLSETPPSLAAFSRQTGTPVSTLRSRMRSGLRKIRNYIQNNGGVP